MPLRTATRFRWEDYTMKWTVRVVVASVLCSLLVWALGPAGLVGMLIGGIVSMIVLGAVFLWTVAEMIEDGLSRTENAI